MCDEGSLAGDVGGVLGMEYIFDTKKKFLKVQEIFHCWEKIIFPSSQGTKKKLDTKTKIFHFGDSKMCLSFSFLFFLRF